VVWGDIGRRVFAKNSFDGILTIIGIIIGNYIAGVQNAAIVITTGLAACVAMGVSGVWATYFIERAERRKERLELERQTLRELNNTKIEKAANYATCGDPDWEGVSCLESAWSSVPACSTGPCQEKGAPNFPSEPRVGS